MQNPLTRRAFTAAALWQAGASVIRLSQKVRMGLIGVEGHSGEITDHLRRLPDVELVAASDATPSELRAVHALRTYPDYRQMLAREELDLAAVCNGNGERAEAILACLDRKLHVIAEKPFAIELADLGRIRRAVAAAGVHISTLLPMRFTPPYLAMRRAFVAGDLGDVGQIAAQKSYKLGQRPGWFHQRSTYGGTIAWIGIHMIDLMRYTSGRDFREVYSYTGQIGSKAELGDMEDVTASLFRLDNGGVAVLRMDYLRPETAPSHGDDRLRLAGAKGIIEYQPATGVVMMNDHARPRLIQDLPPGRSVFVDFLESIYLGKPSDLTADEIFRVNEITLKARDSAEQHRAIGL